MPRRRDCFSKRDLLFGFSAEASFIARNLTEEGGGDHQELGGAGIRRADHLCDDASEIAVSAMRSALGYCSSMATSNPMS
jgi:hypothetical protein